MPVQPRTASLLPAVCCHTPGPWCGFACHRVLWTSPDPLLAVPAPVLHTAHRATSGASTPPSASVVRDDARLVAGRTAPAPLTSTGNRTLTFLGRIRPAPAAKCLRQVSTDVRRHRLILEEVWRWPLDAAASSFQRVPVIAQRRHFVGCFVLLRSENGARILLMPRVHTCTSAHCVQCIQELGIKSSTK